jgi:hypothetical protein
MSDDKEDKPTGGTNGGIGGEYQQADPLFAMENRTNIDLSVIYDPKVLEALAAAQRSDPIRYTKVYNKFKTVDGFIASVFHKKMKQVESEMFGSLVVEDDAAAILLTISKEADYFINADSVDDVYAEFEFGDRVDIGPVWGKNFGRWLTGRYEDVAGRAPPREAGRMRSTRLRRARSSKSGRAASSIALAMSVMTGSTLISVRKTAAWWRSTQRVGAFCRSRRLRLSSSARLMVSARCRAR